MMLDIKKITDTARKELTTELSDKAITTIKELYIKREKAQLVVRNIDREIEQYLQDLADNVVYESAGVGTVNNK